MFDGELLVVGAGINGLWTAYTSCMEGRKTLLLEQFPMLHSRGSSHGHTRIIRYGYAKPHHARMMPFAFEQWKELENVTGCKLIKTTGLLAIYINDEESYNSTLKNYKGLNIKHEVLSSEEVQRRFTGIHLEPKAKYLYEPDGGIINADKARLALQNEILRLGGKIIHSCHVDTIEPMSDKYVVLKTNKGQFSGNSLAITCGPWAKKILSKIGISLPTTPLRISVHYWKESEFGVYSYDGFPAVIKYTDNHIYSIPSMEYRGMMKVCSHTGVACDPDKRDENEEKELEAQLLRSLKREKEATFSKLESSPSVKETCIYTESPDRENILDRHPRFRNIVFAAGFSGSGFKTAPAIAKMLLDMIHGEATTPDVNKMSMKRFAIPAQL